MTDRTSMMIYAKNVIPIGENCWIITGHTSMMICVKNVIPVGENYWVIAADTFVNHLMKEKNKLLRCVCVFESFTLM